MRLNEWTSILYSGRDNDIDMERLAIMMAEEEDISLIDWTPVNERTTS